MDVNKKTQRNRFTRMCIGEAIVELMKRETLDKITVSQIAKKSRYFTYDLLSLL